MLRLALIAAALHRHTPLEVDSIQHAQQVSQILASLVLVIAPRPSRAARRLLAIQNE